MLTKNTLVSVALFLVATIGLFENIFAQPGPPGGAMGGPPCWPPSTCETPINNELVILIVAGLALTFLFIKKQSRKTAL
jgi:hypothetical protein